MAYGKKTTGRKNKTLDNMSKSERLMKGIGKWCSFYRLFPHLFVQDYLGITLKPFQQIILYCMQHWNYLCYIASRGQGKKKEITI